MRKLLKTRATHREINQLKEQTPEQGQQTAVENTMRIDIAWIKLANIF